VFTVFPLLVTGSASPEARGTERPVRVLRLKAVWVTSGRAPSVAVRFVLKRKARITFVLQGPGPTCRTAALLRVKGHRGVNEVRLTATVRRKKLAAGTYRLAPRLPARGKSLGIYVTKTGQVVPLRKPPREPQCAQTVASVGLPFFFTNTPIAGANPATPAPAAGVAGAKIGGTSGGRVALPRTPTGIRGDKIAKSGLVFDQSPTSVLRFLSIVIGVLLALTIPVVFVAAAWRDLHRSS
jgi:hypothetical protein